MLDKIYYTHKIEITPELAFDMLLEATHMKEYVWDEEGDYIIKGTQLLKKDKATNKYEVCFDEEGLLFVALRNVAVNLYPNLSFRNDKYIIQEEDDE